jgi:nicotinamidase-related amidase
LGTKKTESTSGDVDSVFINFGYTLTYENSSSCHRHPKGLLPWWEVSISQTIGSRPDATFFISGDRGTDIHDSAAHFEGEPIVYKHEPNAFLNTNLLELLKSWEIERVVITGMMTHMCVDATARAASDLGFQVIIAEDACATRDLQYGDTTIPAELVHKAFLAALKSYGKVLKSEEILALLAAEMAK